MSVNNASSSPVPPPTIASVHTTSVETFAHVHSISSVNSSLHPPTSPVQIVPDPDTSDVCCNSSGHATVRPVTDSPLADLGTASATTATAAATTVTIGTTAAATLSTSTAATTAIICTTTTAIPATAVATIGTTATSTATVAAAEMMELAFCCAEAALARDEVPVGCVFVDTRSGTVVARAGNTVNATGNATRHAELNCVDQVVSSTVRATGANAAAAQWRHLQVFVTVEPCIMCAAALCQLAVHSVIYGCANRRFGGCGSVLDVTQHGVTSFVHDVTYAERAISLLKRFYCGENTNAPPEKRKRKLQQTDAEQMSRW